MSRKLKRLLLSCTLGLGVVLLVGALLFVFFVYNPFEGTVESLDRLVPRSVAFFIDKPGLGRDLRALPDRESFRALSDSGPVLAFLNSDEFSNADQLYAIRDNLDRIKEVNDTLPIDIFEDVFGEEIAVAGSPLGTDVTEWDFIFYSRVSWKVRAGIDLCTHPQIKDRIQLDPGVDLSDVEGGQFKCLTMNRSGKAHRFFFDRVKDVFVLTNKIELMRDVISLGRGGAGTSLLYNREYKNRTDVVPESEADVAGGGEVDPFGVYFDLREVRNLFGIDAKLEAKELGTGTGVLAEMIGVRAMGQLFGVARPESPFTFEGRILLDPVEGGAERRRILTTAGLPIQELRDRVVPIVPAKTFFFMFMRCAVRDLFDLITTNFSDSDRQLIDDSLNKIPELLNLEDFLGKTASHFSDEIVVLLSRRDFERLEGADRYNPKPAMTLVLQALNPKSLDDYLGILERDEFALAGIQKVEIGGRTVTHGISKIDGSEMAYSIFDNHFVISSSRDFLDAVILTAAGEMTGLGEDPGFRETLDFFGEKSTLLTYLNGAGAADWLADYSGKLSNDHHFMGPDGWRQFRAKVRQELLTNNRSLRGNQLEQEIDRRAEVRQEEIDEVEIPRTMEEIKRYTEWGRVIRSFGLSLTFEGEAVEARGMVHMETATP